MIWRKSTTKRPYIFDCIISKEIIYDALNEGYIKWHIYNLAIEKITSNMNRSLLFGNEWEIIVKEWEDKYLEKRKNG